MDSFLILLEIWRAGGEERGQTDPLFPEKTTFKKAQSC